MTPLQTHYHYALVRHEACKPCPIYHHIIWLYLPYVGDVGCMEPIAKLESQVAEETILLEKHKGVKHLKKKLCYFIHTVYIYVYSIKINVLVR